MQRKSGIVIYNESYKLNLAEQSTGNPLAKWFLTLMSLRLRNLICNAILLFVTAFHVLQPVLPVSARYPHLLEVVNITFSFGVFALLLAYSLAKMTE